MKLPLRLPPRLKLLIENQSLTVALYVEINITIKRVNLNRAPDMMVEMNMAYSTRCVKLTLDKSFDQSNSVWTDR